MSNKFSYGLLMSVYIGDTLCQTREAIESFLPKINLFKEIFIVIDGEVKPDVNRYLIEISHKNCITLLRLKKNLGLAKALNFGLQKMSSDYIFRMDSDDINLPDRFSLQQEFLELNPEITLLGGQIEEFDSNSKIVIGYRLVPTSTKEIKKIIRWRNPFNHPTVCFKRETVLSIGGYHDFRFFEDWDLWDRLIHDGHKCINLPEVLLRFRTSPNQYTRRRGFKYLKLEIQFLKERLRKGRMDFFAFVIRSLIAYCMRLLPFKIYSILFKKALR